MNLDGRKAIDITPVITENIAVFPGDTTFQRNELLSFKNGNNLVLSSITTTVHLGAHTDAPSHYHSDGKTIEERDLSFYMGDCQVIEIENKKERILPEDLSEDIKEKIKNRIDGLTKISYGIFSTKYEVDYVYCVAHSSLIQYRETEKKALQL